MIAHFACYALGFCGVLAERYSTRHFYQRRFRTVIALKKGLFMGIVEVTGTPHLRTVSPTPIITIQSTRSINRASPMDVLSNNIFLIQSFNEVERVLG
jgi:hypothetical protein